MAKSTAADMLSSGWNRKEPPQTPAAETEPAQKATPTAATRQEAAQEPALAPPPEATISATYERQTIFLTAELRSWLRKTVKDLESDSLKISDVGRLALRRLRQDVDNGLDLEALLVQQLNEESQLAPGRLKRHGSTS